eukprot:351253-Chlamydomonas_euryale.AAC.4
MSDASPAPLSATRAASPGAAAPTAPPGAFMSNISGLLYTSVPLLRTVKASSALRYDRASPKSASTAWNGGGTGRNACSTPAVPLGVPPSGLYSWVSVTPTSGSTKTFEHLMGSQRDGRAHKFV